MIISVGYRVNSKRATQFRRWATNVLREFTLKGYIIDRKRMEKKWCVPFWNVPLYMVQSKE